MKTYSVETFKANGKQVLSQRGLTKEQLVVIINHREMETDRIFYQIFDEETGKRVVFQVSDIELKDVPKIETVPIVAVCG